MNTFSTVLIGCTESTIMRALERVDKHGSCAVHNEIVNIRHCIVCTDSEIYLIVKSGLTEIPATSRTAPFTFDSCYADLLGAIRSVSRRIPFSGITVVGETRKNSNPFLKVTLESDQDAQKLIRRAILIKNIYVLWAEGDSYEQVHAQIKDQPELWQGKYNDESFKFTVGAFNSTISVPDQREIINSFSYLDFQGPISMKNPDVQFTVLEDYGSGPPDEDRKRQWIYMGRLVATGGRDVVQRYNLKKRKYLGTTSMDAELSLVMANQAQAAPGKLIYDPFVGTGSFLFTCAHFGAFTLGSDIDGRQIRGKAGKGVKSNIEQYNLQARVLDSLVFDVCHHPWRIKGWLDAIVTDPPYGVRAGAKRLGRKEDSKKTLQMRTYEGSPMHTREDYYPPTKPYEMSEVLADLLNFAAEHLRVGGRLVYWLPTVVDEYSSADLPQHPSMALVSNSEQNFGQWARRLITMEKIRKWDPTQVVTAADTESSCIPKPATDEEQDINRPGHYLFREKYFAFGRSEESGPEPETKK